MSNMPNGIRRRIVQPKFAGTSPIEVRPAPPVYRSQAPAQPAGAPKQAFGASVQLKTSGFRTETRPAPPTYNPASTAAGVQAKPSDSSRMETRPAPPVYRPQPSGILAQAKLHTAPLQAQSQYELGPAVWIGQGRQQIRVRAKGSPTPVGSVDLHFNQPGKAFISNLEVAQAHRKHGLGSMLMKAALDSARRLGTTATALEANPGPGSISKQALVSMYQKLGFKNNGMSTKGNPIMAIQGKIALPRVQYNETSSRNAKKPIPHLGPPDLRILQPKLASDSMNLATHPAAMMPGHVVPAMHVSKSVIQRAQAVNADVTQQDLADQLESLPEVRLIASTADIRAQVDEYMRGGGFAIKVVSAARLGRERATTFQSIALFQYMYDNALRIHSVATAALKQVQANNARWNIIEALQAIILGKTELGLFDGGVEGRAGVALQLINRTASFLSWLREGRVLLTNGTPRNRLELTRFLDSWSGNLDAKAYGRRLFSLQHERAIHAGAQTIDAQWTVNSTQVVPHNENNQTALGDRNVFLDSFFLTVQWDDVEIHDPNIQVDPQNPEANGEYNLSLGQQARFTVRVLDIDANQATVRVMARL